MSERTKTVTEDIEVIDCDVCKKESNEAMLCHVCHRDFCVEHQEGGGGVYRSPNNRDQVWVCPDCWSGARAVGRLISERHRAAYEQDQRDWVALSIEQQAKHWPE